MGGKPRVETSGVHLFSCQHERGSLAGPLAAPGPQIPRLLGAAETQPHSMPYGARPG